MHSHTVTEVGRVRARGPVDATEITRDLYAEVADLRCVGRGDQAAINALARLPYLKGLRLVDATDLDLSVLGELGGLAELTLVRCRRITRLPSRLPASLRWLSVSDSRPAELEALADLVGRSWLPRLQTLELVVGEATRPAEVDLGLVRSLGELHTIRLRGVRHVGAAESPLVPPFRGLPEGLEHGSVDIDAIDPEAVETDLREHFGLPARRRWVGAPGTTPSPLEQERIDRCVLDELEGRLAETPRLSVHRESRWRRQGS